MMPRIIRLFVLTLALSACAKQPYTNLDNEQLTAMLGYTHIVTHISPDALEISIDPHTETLGSG